MYYLVIVSDNKVIIEQIRFSYRVEALYYAECRRKQGYFVTVEPI